MPKISPAFQQAYQTLNPEQRHAVDVIDGPVMVMAGPGTGKTQILATRIANILLNTDTNPSSILAVTFTESGAVAMRKRLISLIGETAYQVHISTFHSFCLDVIGRNAEYFPQISGNENIGDFDRFEVFENIFQNNSFEFIKPINAPLFYLKDAMSTIQSLKREGVMPERFQTILDQEAEFLANDGGTLKKTERAKREKNLAKNRELLKVFELYQQELLTSGRYDFEDMIAYTIQAFEQHELLLQEYQERFLYFLVDEYQDTNSAQNRIVELLASFWGEEANVFVVGDPNQSIYRFQGASLENTYGFLKKYPNATVIGLKQNYRSTQTILNASASLISHNKVEMGKWKNGKMEERAIENTNIIEQPNRLIPQLPNHATTQQPNNILISQSGVGTKLNIVNLQTNSLEQVYIAEHIKLLLDQGVPPSEIVIICRKNAQLPIYAYALYKWGITTHVEGGSDILKDPIINQLLLLFQVIYAVRTGVEDVDLFTVMNYEWMGLDRDEIFVSYRNANLNQTNFWDELQHIPEPDNTAVTTPSTLITFVKNVKHWSTLEPTVPFTTFFETVMTDSGYLNYVLNRFDSVSALNKLNSLFSEVKRLVNHDHEFNLQRFLEVITTMRTHDLQIQEEELESDSNAVTLITAHKAKGLEWQHVFITHGVDKNWGNNRSMQKFTLPEGILQFTEVDKEDRNEDERRLFYVALTRAKQQVTITVPQKIASNSGMKQTTPSLFIEEIDGEFKQQVSSSEIEQLPALVSRLLHPPIQEPTPSPTQTELIDSILAKFKMSATALNTYLACAYKFKLNNLLRVPRTKSPILAFGTAVHSALEKLNRHLMVYHGELLDKNAFVSAFRDALEKEIITKEEFIVRLAHGQEILEQYYDAYTSQLPTPLAVEQAFGRGASKPFLDDIPLSGKIDKIEWLDQIAKTVKLIDYKTGKPKTRGQIEGTTQDSDGGYKRQLVFYKLLTELDRNFPYDVAEAEFDFIEPTDSGKLKKEKFFIMDQEVEDLKVVIKEVMQKIRAHEFPRTTDYSICADCPFQDHCWPEGIPIN